MHTPRRYPWWFHLLLMLGAVAVFLLGYQWGNDYQRRRAPVDSTVPQRAAGTGAAARLTNDAVPARGAPQPPLPG
jgi:hypothetical protein